MDNKQYSTRELFRRFAPYFKKYRFTLWMDLFCAALTTVCELVLPLIMRYITNEGLRDLASLSVKTILSLGVLYFGLRIVDCIASYYMSDMGHVMGAKIETDMRRDAYNHLQKLSNTYYNNTKVGQIMGRITNDLFDGIRPSLPRRIFHRRNQDRNLFYHSGKYQSAADIDDLSVRAADVRCVHDPEFPDAKCLSQAA